MRGDEYTRDERRTKKISLVAPARNVKKEVDENKKCAHGMFYHVRLAACHDLTLRYLLVSVSLGGKSISLRRYCENASCTSVHPSATAFAIHHARSKCIRDEERLGRSVFPFLFSSPSLPLFFFSGSIEDRKPFGF